MPSLFGYEGTKNNYRMGYITNIVNRDKKIYIEYKFYENIDEIPFSVINELSIPLDIREWEINRTHWAIKDGDLSKILNTKGIFIDNYNNDFINHKMYPKTNKQPANSTLQRIS